MAFGYPKSDIKWAAPKIYKEHKDYNNLKEFVDGKFKGTKGRFLKESQDLIAANVATAGGMSGSPLICINEDKIVLCGLLLGGPAFY